MHLPQQLYHILVVLSATCSCAMRESKPIPRISALDLWLPGVHGCHPGRGQRRVGEEGGLPVSELPALGPSCGQLPVLGLPLLLVLRHHSQHGGADLSIRQVI